MQIHYLQHVAFEDAANIGVWAHERGHRLTRTRLDLDPSLPEPKDLDWLVVMGGPMNVDEHAIYPWLVREKEFIRRTIDRGIPVLGVCLGGQLISSVLGGQVTKNRQKEIGWFPVTFTSEAARLPVFARFPPQVPAFHWHGDTFSIPPAAIRLAASDGCDNQAFQYGRRVVALQFHWDYTQQSVETMIRHCGGELVAARGIQQPAEMLAHPGRFGEIKELLYEMLDALAEGK
ncbi:MAG: type 1 glutamine amidotransferase [Thermoguttaceae bacterium]